MWSRTSSSLPASWCMSLRSSGVTNVESILLIQPVGELVVVVLDVDQAFGDRLVVRLLVAPLGEDR